MRPGRWRRRVRDRADQVRYVLRRHPDRPEKLRRLWHRLSRRRRVQRWEMRDGDRVLSRIDLYHQGKGVFQGNFTIPRSLKNQEQLSLRVVAADAEGVNSGFDEIPYRLVPWEKSRDATGQDIPPIRSN